MFRSNTGVLVAALSLAACSNKQSVDMDPTPIRPTAVLEAHVVSQGIADFPAFESVTLSYTRANMQRTETSVKGSGPISQFLDVETNVRIERLDRKLAWTLDTKNKRITECPLPLSSSTVVPGTAVLRFGFTTSAYAV